MLRRILLGGVSITTAATHVRVLCMRYCNGLIAYILLHYLMKFHLEITKDKEMTIFLYVLSDHPTYVKKLLIGTLNNKMKKERKNSSCMLINIMSHSICKPTICICENKGTDQFQASSMLL